MKKSEAVKLISNILENHLRGNQTALATQILEALLKKGMLPPTTEIPFKNIIGAVEFKRDNCWDKEDE